MDEQAAPAAGTSLWCRYCDEPVMLLGQPGTDSLFPSLRKAVHAATGSETGPDGHVAAPMDQRAASAR